VSKQITFNKLTQLAALHGLSLMGLSDPSALSSEITALVRWQSLGYAADMAFMQRDAQLFTTPTTFLPQLKSVVSFGAFYDRGERPELRSGFGRVARYAWGRDYHTVFKKRIVALCKAVKADLGKEVNYKVFTDAVPLLERALASSAGLGFIGKNTMLIVPRAGSFLFLGEVLWDLEVTDPPNFGLKHQRGDCKSCTQCIELCPTGALVDERVLDASKCISYLTIEKRGALTHIERRWLGEWVFGCDVCQDVCPFNVISIKGRSAPDLPEFSSSEGIGGVVNLRSILSIRGDYEFLRRFAGTPIMRTKREGLLRNASVVAANTKCVDILDDLAGVVSCDPSAIVRGHALWGYWELAKLIGSAVEARCRGMAELCLSDSSEFVRSEARLVLERG
jgi:epoxyqueuosine reductase